MSEYKGIKGFQVQTRSSDPTPTEVQTGDFYYNSTTGQFKTLNTGGAPIGTWASATNLNTGRGNGIGGGGTQDAALAFAGGEPTRSNKVEEYNGSSWTETTELGTARDYTVGCGVTAEACMCGPGAIAPGGNYGNTEVWNGSSWSEVADPDPAGYYRNLAGSSTSAIISGGGDPSHGNQDIEEVDEYNGSSWTEIAELNTARGAAAGIGIAAPSIMFAAGTNTGGPGNNAVEIWNGSSWTEVSEVNQARYAVKGFGLTTSGTIAGGAGPASANLTGKTEFWDGTSWTEVNDMATARRSLGSGTGSPSSVGIVFGGDAGSPVSETNVTEEFTGAAFQIKTVTTS